MEEREFHCHRWLRVQAKSGIETSSVCVLQDLWQSLEKPHLDKVPWLGCHMWSSWIESVLTTSMIQTNGDLLNLAVFLKRVSLLNPGFVRILWLFL